MKCDVCSNLINENEGYLLTTYEVLKSKAYWKMYWEKALSFLEDKKLDRKKIILLASKWASNSKPWLVCEQCVGIFSINRGEAKENAINWKKTRQPSSGMELCRVTDDFTVFITDDYKYTEAINAAVNGYDKYYSSISVKWWQFWKIISALRKSNNEESTYQFVPHQTKDYANKTKKCIKCGAELFADHLRCSKCGSDRFIWE